MIVIPHSRVSVLSLPAYAYHAKIVVSKSVGKYTQYRIRVPKQVIDKLANKDHVIAVIIDTDLAKIDPLIITDKIPGYDILRWFWAEPTYFLPAREDELRGLGLDPSKPITLRDVLEVVR